MLILAWMALGLIIGFVASKVMNKAGEGLTMNVGLGVVGARLGGWLFHQLGPQPVTGVSLWGLLIAATAAVIVLMGYHTIKEPGARRI